MGVTHPAGNSLGCRRFPGDDPGDLSIRAGDDIGYPGPHPDAAQEGGNTEQRGIPKLLQLVRGVKRADEVIGAIERALDWLKSPNAAWSGATPLSLLDTDIGTESVLDTPGRIEHGIFA